MFLEDGAFWGNAEFFLDGIKKSSSNSDSIFERQINQTNRPMPVLFFEGSSSDF